MGRLFGTDGVRGIANTELTPELAFKLGKVGTYVLKKENKRPIVLIGKDTRVSGDMFESALSAGILAMGGNVIKLGVLPTPAVAFLVKKYEAAAGIMISASHNPYEYNGIKFFNDEGFKLDDSIEDEIEELIVRNIDITGHIKGDLLGKALDGEEQALDSYVEFLISTVDVDFKGMKVVLDCANGAAYQVAEKVFNRLGAHTIAINNKPDGININELCGSTSPESLQKKVLKEHADVGLAFDGDADRLIVVDEKGQITDGDKTIFICAKHLKNKGILRNNKVTVTVMSNIGFHKACAKEEIKVDTTKVGDRYVLESMLKSGSIIGGEQSGHIIFLNHTTTGDGILSALQFMQAIKESGKRPSEMAEEMVVYPQVLKNAKIKRENRENFDKDTEIKEKISQTEKLVGSNGRVLIRPSGTEPLIRVMLEGDDSVKIERLAGELAGFIEERLG